MNYLKYLTGGDFRSLADSRLLIKYIKSQDEFNELIAMLSHPDDIVRMRAADVIEKITAGNKDYLTSHKTAIIAQCKCEMRKEIKWHYALLLSRLPLTRKEAGVVWERLSEWVSDRAESRIVRVNSLQALFEIQTHFPELANDFNLLLLTIESENIPSLSARIRKLKTIRKGRRISKLNLK